jgi:ribonucleoside-diphosphate reductase alpha chain
MQKGKKFLSDLKLYSDYFKWREDLNRYENWQEACEDIINGHRKKYDDYYIDDYLMSALESMKDQVVLASQRNLQYRHSEIMRHNTRMYNCTSTHIMRNRVFQEIFYLGLSGCGVGGGLLIPFVNNVSRIQKRVLGTKTFVVSDSIEGWADSLGVLLSSYFVDNQPFPEYAGYEVKFDYSQVREKGTFISGGFKAPGPDGLKQSLEKIEQLIEKWLEREGNKIRPILAFDIICHASDAVLSGGVRRSALNMIVDPNDQEMIHAKTGNWREENPQRARSNNSVLLLRGKVTKEQFDYLVKLNDGANDIGFVFANSWFDMFNPCFEILKIPILDNIDFSKIDYEDVEHYTMMNKDKFGIQGCNLSEINAEKCTTKEKFFKACKDATILGTLQAGYNNFPYLGETSEKIFAREALLGVSITGWMNNPMLFNAELLREGAEVVKKTNKELAEVIGINQAARTTCVKPSGNASVVLGTASGIHPEHSENYFRVMQLNKESNTAKWLVENMDFLLEDSVWSQTKSDYVVFVPVENPKKGLFKKDMKGIKHLELIKLVQQNWVNAGTNPEKCVYNPINHNTSCTVIIDDKDAIVNYIWDNKEEFTAVSFMSDYGDKDFNQAPFTSVLNLEELVTEYGKGAVLASGLVVDGLHYFDNNLWLACDTLINMGTEYALPITGTREQVLLKKYWLDRAKKFAKNYFKGDMRKMVYCLKDVHLFHKWETVTRQFKEVNFGEILDKPQYKDIGDYGAMSCSGNQCEITRI